MKKREERKEKEMKKKKRIVYLTFSADTKSAISIKLFAVAVSGTFLVTICPIATSLDYEKSKIMSEKEKVYLKRRQNKMKTFVKSVG